MLRIQSVCALIRVRYLQFDLSSTPKLPYSVPQTTLNPSAEMSTDDTVPSCFASITNSLKSRGHTLRNLSSDPVTQKASLTAIEQILESLVLYVASRVSVKQLIQNTIPVFDATQTRLRASFSRLSEFECGVVAARAPCSKSRHVKTVLRACQFSTTAEPLILPVSLILQKRMFSLPQLTSLKLSIGLNLRQRMLKSEVWRARISGFSLR